MSAKRIQCDRVLAALANAGPYGITRIDFETPGKVIDGGPPILRVAARIFDLEHERGVEIARAGRRKKCAVYVLESVRPGTATTVAPERAEAVCREAVVVPEPTVLPVAGVQPQLAIYDWDTAA